MPVQARQLGSRGVVGDPGLVHRLGDEGTHPGAQGGQLRIDLAQTLGLGAGQGHAVAFKSLDGQADVAGGLLVNLLPGRIHRGAPSRPGVTDQLVQGLETPVETGVEVIGVAVGRQFGCQALLQLVELGRVGG